MEKLSKYPKTTLGVSNNQLLLDYDIRLDGTNPNNKHKKDFRDLINDFIETRKLILTYFGIKALSIRHNLSSSRRGHHFCIDIDKHLNDEQIVDLQILLGSCPTRENINRERIKRKVTKWNKMFARTFNTRKLLFLFKQRKIEYIINKIDNKVFEAKIINNLGFRNIKRYKTFKNAYNYLIRGGMNVDNRNKL